MQAPEGTGWPSVSLALWRWVGDMHYASWHVERLTFSNMSFMKMSWDMQAAVKKDWPSVSWASWRWAGICRLMWGSTDLQHHELHDDELGYAGWCGEVLTFSIMSFMKMSWDMQAALGKYWPSASWASWWWAGICRLMWGKTDLQHHKLHEDELGYAGCYRERLTFSIMSFMKMSWDMQAAIENIPLHICKELSTLASDDFSTSQMHFWDVIIYAFRVKFCRYFRSQKQKKI